MKVFGPELFVETQSHCVVSRTDKDFSGLFTYIN